MNAIKSLEVLRNLRDGDVLWIQVHDETPTDEVDAIHTALEASIEAEVLIIVTTETLVRGIQILSLKDLFTYRNLIESAIEYRMTSTVTEV